MELSIEIAYESDGKLKKQSAIHDDIIKGCIKQDRKAQEILYKTYFGKMMATAMRYLNNQDDSIEAVNSGFLKVFQQIHQYKGQGAIEGWMYHIVRNTIVDFQRKKLKYTAMEGVSIEESMHNSIADSITENLHAGDLLQLLNTLPEATKMVFNLFAIEGFKHQEIAKMLNISEGTSKWHVSEARKLLQLALQTTERRSK